AFPFTAKFIRLALRAGEPSRLAIGLAKEAILTAFDAGSKLPRAEKVRKQAISLAERVSNRLVLAKTTLHGATVLWACGNWKEGLVEVGGAVEIAAQAQVTHAMGLIYAQHYILDCLMMMGRWREMGSCLPVWLKDAQRRGDHFGTCALLVHSYVPCL